jgi:hypothetical protein
MDPGAALQSTCSVAKQKCSSRLVRRVGPRSITCGMTSPTLALAAAGGSDGSRRSAEYLWMRTDTKRKVLLSAGVLYASVRKAQPARQIHPSVR